jgi:membrane protease YdiL (CAAX protease family)
MLTREVKLSLFIVSGYMLVRAIIYYMMPVRSLSDWFYRDVIMCLPRLIGFYMVFRITKHHSGLKMVRTRFVYIYGGLLFVTYALDLVPKGWAPWPNYMVCVGLVTSIVVGLFEEYLFRGALLTGLLRSYPVLSSIFVSSAIFTVYHLQAQPLRSWPGIFLAGLVFANLRLLGLGLLGLSLLHGVIDWSFFLFTPTSNISPVFLAVVALLAVGTFVHVMMGHNQSFKRTPLCGAA